MSVHECHFNYDLNARLATPASVAGYIKLVEEGIASAASVIDEPTVRNLRSWWEVYLIASYLYYIKDVSLLTDAQFDFICKKLLAVDEEHLLKTIRTYGLYDRSCLDAGSGFHIKRLPYYALYAAELYEKRLS